MAKEKKEKKEKTKTPTARKREGQNVKRRDRNRQFKAGVRTEIRKFKEIAAKDDKKAVEEQLNTVYSLLDKGVQKGTYKLNSASRAKSRLASLVAANQR